MSKGANPDITTLLAAMQEAEAKATGGEWQKPFADGAIISADRPMESLLGLDRDGMAIFDNPDDAAFVCAIRNAAPRLFAEIERLQREVNDYRAALKELAEGRHWAGDVYQRHAQKALDTIDRGNK